MITEIIMLASSIIEPLQEANITQKFPHGESYEDVKKRINEFIDQSIADIQDLEETAFKFYLARIAESLKKDKMLEKIS